MDPRGASASQVQVEAFGRRQRTGLVTLVFTDMVESTALKQQLGDHAGAQLIEQHHALVRATLHEFPDGEELSTSGDSFFLVFATPSAGVEFALVLQQRLRELSRQAPVPVQDRMGLHLGEVLIQEAGQQRPKDLIGLNVDLGARVMSLAQGGQILLTRAVFDSARQSLKGQEIEGISALDWLSHGRFELKGVSEPVEICEVRATGIASLSPPTTSEKARRVEAAEGEAVLGWRPAVGQQVGRTDWVLEEKLGEGGFGEVWVGQHRKLRDRRVFKFCFRADRIRSLKRELTLFRLLKERIGEHPNIVRLHEVYFDEPPYFLEEDYVEGRDLARWCEAQGGVKAMPLETRLEIAAQVADALQAAHECGVIHRDVKPGNILVSGGAALQCGSEKSGPLSVSNTKPAENTPEPAPATQSASRRRAEAALWRAAKAEGLAQSKIHVKLTDFGIGQVVSQECLAGVTRGGFTQTLLPSSSSHAGTQLYLAPELLAGEPATTRSDIYSLGVVLYQLLVGGFNRPLTSDWTEEVADPLLREDVRHCVAGKPEDRFAGAGQLATNLRAYRQRQEERVRKQAEVAERERLRQQSEHRHRLLVAAAAVMLVLMAIAVALGYGFNRAEQQRRRAEAYLYDADMVLAQQALDNNNLRRVNELLEECRPATASRLGRRSQLSTELRGWEWRYMWGRSRSDELYTLGSHKRVVEFVVFSDDGSLLATLSQDSSMKLWDMAARREIATISPTYRISDLCFVPSSRTVAVAAGKEVCFLDGLSGQRTGAIACEPYVASLAFSRDGRRLALYQGTDLRMLEALTRREVWRTTVPAGWRVAFSPDNVLLAAATDESIVLLLDAASGKQIASLPGFGPSWLGSLVFSPDGELLACASGSGGDPKVRIWEVRTRQPRHVVEYPGAWISGVAFSPDGKTMAISGAAHVITLFDRETWQVAGRLQGHLDEAWAVAFSPDGKRLVSGSKDTTVRVWESVPKPVAITELPLPDGLDAFKFSTDGNKLCLLTTNKTYAVWDTTALRQVASGPLPFTNITHYAAGGFTMPSAISKDGRRLFVVTPTGQVHVWDTQRRESRAVLESGVPDIWVVALSPDEKTLAVAGSEGLVRLWDLQTQAPLRNLPHTTKQPTSIVFSPDSQLVAIGCGEGQVEVWQISGPRKLFSSDFHTMFVLAVAISPDDRYLAVAGVDARVTLWDLQRGTLLNAFSGALNSYNCVAFSRNGQRLFAGGSPDTLGVWDTRSLQSVGTFKGHLGRMQGLTVHSETEAIVSVEFVDEHVGGVHAGAVHLWRAPSWDEIAAAEKKTERKTQQR